MSLSSWRNLSSIESMRRSSGQNVYVYIADNGSCTSQVLVFVREPFGFGCHPLQHLFLHCFLLPKILWLLALVLVACEQALVI